MRNQFTSILHQYNKTKLFWIFCLPCHQTEIKTISQKY